MIQLPSCSVASLSTSVSRSLSVCVIERQPTDPILEDSTNVGYTGR